MTGLSWTYETLCEFIPSFTRHLSASTSAADLNPIIKQLLTIFPGSSILGLGGHSVLLSISKDIAAKVSLKPGDSHLRHEQSIFELLDRTSCSSVIQIFLRCPDITFMQPLRNGTLYQRMTMVDRPRPTLRWIQQLADAAACIESLGYAHGDINPRNILFDDDDQLKLIDFDHALEAGADLDVGDAPYVRAQKVGSEGGTFGVAGPATEQFALGSVFWYITRETELYTELEGSERVNRLIDGQFPSTDPQNPVDNIISNCWLGSFESVSDLSKHIREISMVSETELDMMRSSETYDERKKTCEQYYQLLKGASCQ
jgi:serine/threonine protein kinase